VTAQNRDDLPRLLLEMLKKELSLPPPPPQGRRLGD
jgi:hypothetical protein